ncbi:DNA internalization-related competence protein ComEC/Rec2 [Oxalobacteraceae bacterium]|nr:DNA internalization-related competence protein ComEC/Rec2 [Oxalobacteraceae bacterium]
MRIGLLGFVAGAGMLQTRAALPEWPWLFLLLGAVLMLVTLRIPFLFMRFGAGLMSGALLGVGWAALMAQAALAPSLAAGDEGRDVTVVGTIDSLPYRFSQGVRFNFAIERVVDAPAKLPPRVALGWYLDGRGQQVDVGDVQPGERWQLTVRLQRPHGNVNPYGFDYEVWLLEQGVRATGYVRQASDNRRLDHFVFSFGNVVERARALLRERILTALPEHEYAGVIVALVVGDQRGIDPADWQVFSRTGISHLISISGLHITMVAGLFALAASALWRRSCFTGGQWPLLLPAQKVAALTGATVALLYVLLAGFGIPAQRTLYMLIVVALALWTGRITSVSYVLCAALGLVTLLDPWAVLWPGFWLSFGAVAMILYATTGRTVERSAEVTTTGGAPPTQQRRTRLWFALVLAAHTQYVVTLGLVPLTMLLFAQVSVVSPLANAVAIPLISLLVTPLALIGSLLPLPLAALLLGLAHWLVAQLAALLAWCSAAPFAVWSAPAPSWPVFCWALFGTIWMLAPRGWPVRWLGLVTWIPLLSAVPDAPAFGALRVTAFDVGQGTSLLIETSGHRLLYDSGPRYSEESNAGNRVLVPYLRARGIDKLDAMLISHSDADHAGGALAVLDAADVGWVISSLWQDHPIVRAAARHTRCMAGQSWNWDGVRFEMLHPEPASYGDAALKPNARGCTLRISTAHRSILLAADIEAPQEAQLLQRARASLHADVLLAPHHGSGTSSTPAFLMAVQPSIGIFQVGHRNRYHHPKQEVYERYGQMAVRRLRTDVSGALTLTFGREIEVREQRQVQPRYWYLRP